MAAHVRESAIAIVNRWIVAVIMMLAAFLLAFTVPVFAVEKQSARPSWTAIKSFAYQLQNIDLAEIGSSNFDLAVIDYSKDGSAEQCFSREQISALHQSSGGPKRILAYMSIGEAEDYRWYWQKQWDANHDGRPDNDAPAWLGPANPEWPGNYKVRYWDPNWQAIVFQYLDKIIDAGFDGVYLDIIDGFEYWGPEGESGLNRKSAERDMVEFVKAMADHARNKRRRADFGIFPNNGEALARYKDYLEVVTGIGREDTWYNGNKRQPASGTEEVVANLDKFRSDGKLVLCIDYVTKPRLIDDFYSKAKAHGFIPYATVRNLGKLTINKN